MQDLGTNSENIGRNLGNIGVIGRFKPLHNGAALMLEMLCKNATHVKIGIGSCNPEKYGIRNPFTPQETRDMIDATLKPKYSNYEILFIPDFGHIPEYADGKKWKSFVSEAYGRLDHFITGNAYVANLMADTYDIIDPRDIIPKDQWVFIKGSMVRMFMAQGIDYSAFVPQGVYTYLHANKLDERFRKEFGEETLKLNEDQWKRNEDYNDERRNITGK